MSVTGIADRTAVAASSLCIVHCLAAPVATVILPLSSAFFAAEGVHIALATLAICAALAVALFGRNGRSPAFSVPAASGAFFLIAGILSEQIGVDERAATVIGSLLLAAAHLHRIRTHHQN